MTMKNLHFHPLTPDRFDDFVHLFGEEGGHGGCWCMWWRMNEQKFIEDRGEANKNAMRELVNRGELTGYLAYVDGRPAAWCSFGPREVFPNLNESKKYCPVDDESVWSIVCFFVDPAYRRQGIMEEMLKVAIDCARSAGAKVVEGYPLEVKKPLQEFDGFTGIVSTYQKLGFKEVIRRHEDSPIMRYQIK